MCCSVVYFSSLSRHVFWHRIGRGQLGPIIQVSGRQRFIFINIFVIFMPVIGLSMADIDRRQVVATCGQMSHVGESLWAWHGFVVVLQGLGVHGLPVVGLAALARQRHMPIGHAIGFDGDPVIGMPSRCQAFPVLGRLGLGHRC